MHRRDFLLQSTVAAAMPAAALALSALAPTAAAHSTQIRPPAQAWQPNRRFHLFLLAFRRTAPGQDRRLHHHGRRDGLRRRGNPRSPNAPQRQRLPAGAKRQAMAPGCASTAFPPTRRSFRPTGNPPQNVEITTASIELAYAWASRTCGSTRAAGARARISTT